MTRDTDDSMLARYMGDVWRNVMVLTSVSPMLPKWRGRGAQRRDVNEGKVELRGEMLPGLPPDGYGKWRITIGGCHFEFEGDMSNFPAHDCLGELYVMQVNSLVTRRQVEEDAPQCAQRP